MSSAYQSPVLVRMLLASTRGARFKLSIYASDDPYGRGFSDALKADMLKARPNALMKALTGQPPAFRDSGAYDAATTLMLAAILAAQQNHLADPAEVTGAQIRDAMRAISDQHGEPVNAGEEGFARALQLIAAGKPIDYQGASGPCHYDAHGDVVAQLVRFQVRGGRFADAERFDCVRDASCPPVRALGKR